jgi:PAS domain-containing protein
MSSRWSGVEPVGLYRAIMDAIPSPVFVVEEDVRIVDYNLAASKLAAADREFIIRRRGGEVLHCLRASETPEGCGRAPACHQCIVRSSVSEALNGRHVARQRARVQLVLGTDVVELYLLITAAPFEHEGKQLALLILEDISELIALRGIIPICAGCKKIRDDEEYWHQVDTYFSKHLDIEFTHGLCPDCAEKYFPPD